jgi:hypothetical protein
MEPPGRHDCHPWPDHAYTHASAANFYAVIQRDQYEYTYTAHAHAHAATSYGDDWHSYYIPQPDKAHIYPHVKPHDRSHPAYRYLNPTMRTCVAGDTAS